MVSHEKSRILRFSGHHFPQLHKNKPGEPQDTVSTVLQCWLYFPMERAHKKLAVRLQSSVAN